MLNRKRLAGLDGHNTWMLTNAELANLEESLEHIRDCHCHDLRVAGQDTRRGTFSQRHSVLVDYETGAEWAPLAHLDPDQAKFWIYDSLLSE